MRRAEQMRIYEGQQLVDKDHPLKDAPLTGIFPYLRICKRGKKLIEGN